MEKETQNHVPVMVKEVMEYLDVSQSGLYVDATVGAGGHAEKILEALDNTGKLLVIDQNETSLKMAKLRLNRFVNVDFCLTNFRSLLDKVKAHELSCVNGVLFDLGVASWQMQDPDIALSFSDKRPLDMRLDRTSQKTAWDVVNRYNRVDLERILYEYGDEKEAKKIATEIIRRRPVNDTKTLANMICAAKSGKEKKINPATRVFQAIRIEVNEELLALKEGLEAALKILCPRGRVVVLSYHSGEDRIVKQVFKNATRDGYSLLCRKPLKPTLLEVESNPRSRSAKLRAIEKI